MSAVIDKETLTLQDETSEEYEYLTDEKVLEMTDDLIERHREALRALANA